MEDSILRYISGRKWTWIVGLVLAVAGGVILGLTESALILLAIVMIFVGAYYLLRALCKDIPAIVRAKKCLAQLEMKGLKEQAAKELAENSGTVIGIDKTVVTPNFLFGRGNGVAVAYSDILWVYKHRLTQRVIGIPVRTVDSLIIYTAKQKNVCAVNMGRKDKENKLSDVIYLIHSKNSDALLGYTNENRRAYKNRVKA